MNQSIWCPHHNHLHDLRDDVNRAPVSRSLDHLHEVTAWFTSDDREVVECVVCGDQWGCCLSTPCQIEFKSGGTRRTIYRHWDGYPSAVLPDLLAFLAWSTHSGDVECESANFLYWSKREVDERVAHLGFGICANDELHCDVAYYYLVEHASGGAIVRAYAVEREKGVVRVGGLVQEVAVSQPFFSSLSTHPMDAPRACV